MSRSRAVNRLQPASAQFNAFRRRFP